MKIEVYADADSVAREAAKFVATQARAAIANRGSFVMAVSGGRTPWMMLRDLAQEDLPWNAVHIVQVDERVAPAGHPDRNLTHLRESKVGWTVWRPPAATGKNQQMRRTSYSPKLGCQRRFS